jgi:dihydroorotase-like cyclic amidohydrolase
MSILIKGGRVITAADDYVGDVFVEDERISVIGESLDIQADRMIAPMDGCADGSAAIRRRIEQFEQRRQLHY